MEDINQAHPRGLAMQGGVSRFPETPPRRRIM